MAVESGSPLSFHQASHEAEELSLQDREEGCHRWVQVDEEAWEGREEVDGVDEEEVEEVEGDGEDRDLFVLGSANARFEDVLLSC